MSSAPQPPPDEALWAFGLRPTDLREGRHEPGPPPAAHAEGPPAAVTMPDLDHLRPFVRGGLGQVLAQAGAATRFVAVEAAAVIDVDAIPARVDEGIAVFELVEEPLLLQLRVDDGRRLVRCWPDGAYDHWVVEAPESGVGLPPLPEVAPPPAVPAVDLWELLPAEERDDLAPLLHDPADDALGRLALAGRALRWWQPVGPERARAELTRRLSGQAGTVEARVARWGGAISPDDTERLERMAVEAGGWLSEILDDLGDADAVDAVQIEAACVGRERLEGVLAALMALGAGRALHPVLRALDRRVGPAVIDAAAASSPYRGRAAARIRAALPSAWWARSGA